MTVIVEFQPLRQAQARHELIDSHNICRWDLAHQHEI